jgi:hypothetical protein
MDGFLRRLFGSRTFVTFEDGSSIEYLNREAILYKEAGGKQIEIPWYFDDKVSRGRVVSQATSHFGMRHTIESD